MNIIYERPFKEWPLIAFIEAEAWDGIVREWIVGNWKENGVDTSHPFISTKTTNNHRNAKVNFFALVPLSLKCPIQVRIRKKKLSKQFLKGNLQYDPATKCTVSCVVLCTLIYLKNRQILNADAKSAVKLTECGRSICLTIWLVFGNSLCCRDSMLVVVKPPQNCRPHMLYHPQSFHSIAL